MSATKSTAPMQWQLKRFCELSVDELYEIMKLRMNVFIIEQACIYPDLDEKDRNPETLHLFATDGSEIRAYLRLLSPQFKGPSMTSFGRVCTLAAARGNGLGHELIQRAVQALERLWPNLVCHISAQAHLQNFYKHYGFEAVGETYLEDGIPHVGMERLGRILT